MERLFNWAEGTHERWHWLSLALNTSVSEFIVTLSPGVTDTLEAKSDEIDASKGKDHVPPKPMGIWRWKVWEVEQEDSFQGWEEGLMEMLA